MTSVAVVAHQGKSLGGGLKALRRALYDAGVTEPLWYEVPKSRKAPKQVRKAIDAGADLLVIWGGDGMVQRCVDAVGDEAVALAIVPAGTANLFATNLDIPRDIDEAVRIALHGRRRALDVGCWNGERFTVMAGAGWDALMIRDADGALKEHLGRAAYIYAGAKHLRAPRFRASIKVNGRKWVDESVACILVGNVPKVFGGIQAFEDAEPDDGRLELGVVTAKGAIQWGRTLARTALGNAERSPFVDTIHARAVEVKLDRKVDYELDGGHRGRTRRIKIMVQPAAIQVCVPEADAL